MTSRPTELEIAVIQRMLGDPELSPRTDSTPDSFVVEERSFSGVGFISSIARNDTARFFAAGTSMRWGKVMGRLNGVDADFVVYVDDGFVHAIEGVTFGGEAWPSTVNRFELTEVLTGAG